MDSTTENLSMTSGTCSLSASFHSLMRERFISNKMNLRLSMVDTQDANLSHDEIMIYLNIVQVIPSRRSLTYKRSLFSHSECSIIPNAWMRFCVPRLSNFKMTLLKLSTCLAETCDMEYKMALGKFGEL